MLRARQFLMFTAAATSALILSSPLYAQPPQGRGRTAPRAGQLAEEGVSPAEIQRLFDAYVVMQAQQELQLSDDQFPRFLTRVKTLQDVRRRGQGQRGRILQELRRLSQTTGQDDALRAQ